MNVLVINESGHNTKDWFPDVRNPIVTDKANTML